MTPAAGSEVTLAIDSRPQPGWHGYWQHPGDAGFPAKLDWNLPEGVTASAPDYPLPQTLLIAGLMHHVFEKPYATLVKRRSEERRAGKVCVSTFIHRWRE